MKRRALLTGLTPGQVEARLDPFRPPRRRAGGHLRRAAVAAILRFERSGPEVLLIERARRKTDRWSGHVAFPGGRAEEHDRDLAATAVRETREEVGVDLAAAPLLGTLAPVRAIARGRILPMSITPLVFHLAEAQPVALGPEAAASFWLPLAQAQSGALDAEHLYRLGPVPMTFPCWRYQGHVIWGLTFGMLRSLLERLA